MKYYLKIISSTYSEETHTAIRLFLESIVLKIRAEKMVVIDALKPYWKIKGYGEMTVSFLSDCSKAEIESHLGNGWKDDVIDSEWAKIYCPVISFMWLTAEYIMTKRRKMLRVRALLTVSARLRGLLSSHTSALWLFKSLHDGSDRGSEAVEFLATIVKFLVGQRRSGEDFGFLKNK